MIDKEAMLRELMALAKNDERAEDEFTRREFALANRVGYDQARHVLDKLIDKGVIEMRSAIVEGKTTMLYRRTAGNH